MWSNNSCCKIEIIFTKTYPLQTIGKLNYFFYPYRCQNALDPASAFRLWVISVLCFYVMKYFQVLANRRLCHLSCRLNENKIKVKCKFSWFLPSLYTLPLLNCFTFICFIFALFHILFISFFHSFTISLFFFYISNLLLFQNFTIVYYPLIVIVIIL